jgi:uncharacterized protein (DUF433 family)
MLLYEYIEYPNGPDGPICVRGTNVGIERIVEMLHDRHLPEEIAEEYLSDSAEDLELVYGVIAYYNANRKEVDEYIRGQNQLSRNRR